MDILAHNFCRNSVWYTAPCSVVQCTNDRAGDGAGVEMQRVRDDVVITEAGEPETMSEPEVSKDGDIPWFRNGYTAVKIDWEGYIEAVARRMGEGANGDGQQ